MRKFLSALLVGASLIPASAMVVPTEAGAFGSNNGNRVQIEERRDGKNQKIQIRRTFNAAGKLIRTSYYVETPSFGLTPGQYNRYHDIVEPYFESYGNSYGR